MVFLSIPSKLSTIFFFKESTVAKTAIIEKIPTVTPSRERNVRNLLLLKALKAKAKLSFSKRIYSIIKINILNICSQKRLFVTIFNGKLFENVTHLQNGFIGFSYSNCYFCSSKQTTT